MSNIPMAVVILFGITVLISVWLFLKAARYSKTLMILIAAWGIFQSVLSSTGFYTNWDTVPPRLLFMIGPPFILIFLTLLTRRGQQFIGSLDLKTITLMHTIRIPVEISLLYLFLAGLVPQSMTFEGTNLDIISGITAPIVYCLVFAWKKVNGKFLLAWNILCLGLLLNVLITAILSVKIPFQQFAFDQPNVGIAYFPFVLLPAVIVPIVFFSHMAAILRLLKEISRTRSLEYSGILK